MPIPLRLLIVVLIAGIITLVGLLSLRLLTHYLYWVGKQRQRLLASAFGAIMGFIVWPLAILLALRLSPSFYEWMAEGPFPLYYLTDRWFLFIAGAFSIAGPLALLSVVHHKYRGDDIE